MISSRSTLPNLIIAGVHKAGTTSLYSYLAKHPGICPSFRKEIGFFMPLMFDRNIPPIEEYGNYFSHCGNESYRMEASPSYFYGKERIAEAINRELKNVNIIVILRDPTDRLISFFSRAVSKSALPDDMSFQEYLTISAEKQHTEEHSVYSRGVREGIYIDYIRPWQRIFADNLKIVFFDDLKRSAFDLTTSIYEWLQLDTSCFRQQEFTVENQTLQYRHKRLHRYVKDVYMRSEAFWRRNYKLKQQLRKVYNVFNADAGRELQTVEQDSIARLRTMYEPHNKELKLFLESHNYESLPGWLS